MLDPKTNAKQFLFWASLIMGGQRPRFYGPWNLCSKFLNSYCFPFRSYWIEAFGLDHMESCAVQHSLCLNVDPENYKFWRRSAVPFNHKTLVSAMKAQRRATALAGIFRWPWFVWRSTIFPCKFPCKFSFKFPCKTLEGPWRPLKTLEDP